MRSVCFKDVLVLQVAYQQERPLLPYFTHLRTTSRFNVLTYLLPQTEYVEYNYCSKQSTKIRLDSGFGWRLD